MKSSKLMLSGALLLLTVMISAATPFSEYLSRVGQAARMAEAMSAEAGNEQASENTRQAIGHTLRTIRKMLPATEDIEFDHTVVHVDNSWLHQPVERRNPQGGSETLKPEEEIAIVAQRLSALERQLKAAANPAQESSVERERLKQILAQPEYQEELRKESEIERWVKKIQDKIIEFLIWLFGSGERKPSETGSASLRVFRLFLLAATLAALIFGLARLIRRLRLRVKADEEPETREVLGEVITADTSSEDLFRQAAELARQGNYRLAIRRAYIALLFELELRGRLKIHRSRTNRDYLREIGSDQQIYAPVEYMTTVFERAWYGEAETRMEDYSGFVERYREVVSVR